MYIAPNTKIILLHNCPLDNTYDHTIYFSSESGQVAYFQGLAKYTLSYQTYQRVNRGVMRVAKVADELYDCNYLMFQNTAFGSKWFYAFITAVEYVNNTTAEITYEIDVMQTWHFDYELGQCMVEREHAATDNVGDNIVPESLEIGPYLETNKGSLPRSLRYVIVVASTFDDNYEDTGGGFYAGVYSGLNFKVFQNTGAGASACRSFIDGAVKAAKVDGIVAVFLCPADDISGQPPLNETVRFTKEYSLSRSDGKALKNNKLLTYPYSFLYVTNLQGTSAAFPFEFFSGSSCDFVCKSDFSPSPSVLIYPQGYKGSQYNLDQKMILTGFPQLAWVSDSYQSWLAQNAGSIALDGISTAAGAIVGAVKATATFGLTGTSEVFSNFQHALGMLAEKEQRELMPNQAHSAGSPMLMASQGLLHFEAYWKHITPQFVSIIDDFFNMFGYATGRVKVPNRNVRPYWTYTKTIGCVVNGSVPADDMRAICGIYNNGITFWTSGDNVGNYNLNNSV